MKQKYRQFGLTVLFLGYIALMIWLLFGQRSQGESGTENLNIVPFTTLKLYMNLLENSTNHYLVRHAFINLVGNVVMFIPLGYLLPGVYKRAQNFFAMLLYTVVVIVLIETIQYITGLGSCDIDDLILNVPGVMIGWCIRRIGTSKRK